VKSSTTPAPLPAANLPPPPAPTETTTASEPAPAEATALEPQPPAAAEIKTAPAGESDELTTIRASWPRIVSAIGANPANRPLVTNCRPVELTDGALVLGFPEDQAFMRDIADRKRRVLEDGIAAVIGRHVAVRCVVANLELVEPVHSGEGDLVSKAKEIFDGELAGIEDID